MTIPWISLMGCFSPSRPTGWLWRSFHPAWLQHVVDAKCGEGAVTIPADWSTSGWSDVTEVERQGRVIVEKLKGLGVTVTDVPPDDPVRRRFYHGS